MARAEDLREAKRLLAKIPKARTDQRQRLLLAAAITKLMTKAPVVVGGTAEAYWAGGAYHPTDLDLCPRPSRRDIAALESAGLQKVGRFWTSKNLPVAVEFPGSGDDIERTVPVKVGGVRVLMISCEDLYLDRIRQATVPWPHEDVSFDGALEIALANYVEMDWEYISSRIAASSKTERPVGETMHRVNRRVRARARRQAAGRVPS